MNEIIQLSGFFALTFAACFGAAYAWTAWTRKSRKPLSPEVNTTIRFGSGRAMYRSNFVAETAKGWLLSAPIQREHYVPIRIGEEIRAEVTTSKGVLFFRSEVLERSTHPWRLLIRAPARYELRERRSQPRRRDLEGLRAGLDGHAAVLMDLSDLGARVTASVAPERGERLRLDLPWLEAPCFAYVLEVAPPRDPAATGTELRLRFEEPLRNQPVGAQM